MFEKLLLYLKHEEQLISELISLAQRQQKALIKYNLSELEQLTAYQEETSKYLREAEEQRINLIIAWLGISKKDASNIWLSELEKKAKPEEIIEMRQMRKILASKINQLNSINTTNRLLANRARSNVGQIISVLSDGSNQMCNVRV